jgi:hypothetical protein
MLIYVVALKQFGIFLPSFETDFEIIKENIKWNSDSRKKAIINF